MRLSDFFSGNQQINGQGTAVMAQQGAEIREQAQSADTARLQTLTPGQVIRGELVAADGGEVQIRLLNDLLLGAKIDQNMSLELGKLMNFQVRSNGKSLMLTPLQANLSMEGPVSKALEMANLPINSATGEMTQRMMQAGLPIDRNSLSQMYREMINQPTGQIADLVDLHRLGLPVTEENLTQMASYKNLTHQLVSGLADVSQGLMETLSQMQEEGDVFGAAQLYQKLADLLKEEPGEAAGQPAEKTTDARTSVSENLSELFDRIGQEAKQDAHLENALPKGGADAEAAAVTLTGKERYAQALKEALGREGSTANDQFDLISQLMKQATLTKDKDLTEALLSSPHVKKLLADRFDKQWSITPEQVAEPKEVEKLYHRLEKQLSGIEKALETAGKSETPAFQSVNNMNRNVDFSNQVNQMYTYVQLPLRLTQGRAQGDLYVYTNKRNLASKDGPITALLHLDMEHLGPLDVYVSMQMEKVNTKFYVQDEEMLGFLEAHMDLLTERLEKRGYQMSVQTTLKHQGDGEKTSGIEPILAQAAPGLLIQNRGFDVRT